MGLWLFKIPIEGTCIVNALQEMEGESLETIYRWNGGQMVLIFTIQPMETAQIMWETIERLSMCQESSIMSNCKVCKPKLDITTGGLVKPEVQTHPVSHAWLKRFLLGLQFSM